MNMIECVARAAQITPEQARAAIEAMREPTDAMMLAFQLNIVPWMNEFGEDKDTYQAMIDAALQDEGK